MDKTHQAKQPSFRMTSRTVLKVLVLGLIVAAVPMALYVRVFSEDSARFTKAVSPDKSKTSKGSVTIPAAGRSLLSLNLQAGRNMSIEYRGDQATAGALQGGAARARSLASGDFDHNGTPDLVAGYSVNGAGAITIQRGSTDAFAPSDDSVFVRIQQGYDPDSLEPSADVYPVPVSPDLLVVGNFTRDTQKDLLFAAKEGALYLMAGNGAGGFDQPLAIEVQGTVTALAAGEFRAADGLTDVAVGVNGPGGNSLVIFDAMDGFANALATYKLTDPVSAIEFGSLDDDPFVDVAAATGSEIAVVHGWGRKEAVEISSRLQRVAVGSGVKGIALGHFSWDRQGRSELAALTENGVVQILQRERLDTRPFTEDEKARRNRGNWVPGGSSIDVETVTSWRSSTNDAWTKGESFAAGLNSASGRPLLKSNLAGREMDDFILIGESQMELVQRPGSNDKDRIGSNLVRTTLSVKSAPVAVLALPKKLNGVTDVVVLNSTSTEPTILPNAPNTTITVDRTDDPSGGSLAGASACTAAGNDCSLRGALQFANNPANNNTTISVPANTYILSTNGTNASGCDGNAVGDLGANQTMTITGAGAATTIIRQTGTGPANDGDRVMCMNEPFTIGLIYNYSGVTFVGGRDGTAAGTGSAIGGGGIIGGELNNSLTMTNVVMANNQVTVLGSGNLGGGGIQITGGDLIITNSTLGGTSAPGAYTDRTSTNVGNLQAGSGGGVTYTPSSPQHAGGTGTLTVSGSTISRNSAAGIGGGGADFLVFAFASPGGIGSGSASVGTSAFSNNQALGTASGGGIIVESLATTVATTSFTNNSSGNRGGGIFVGGASLLFNGTTPSITFTGNTATSGGSSVSTSSAVNVDGTNTSIGGDIEIGTGGIWTNNAGSTLAPTNVLITGGTLNMNNSTMNVGGNLTIGPGAVVGGTFNGNTGTVNIQGNFVLNAGGAPATALNAGTGTFNFNGTGTQSITNGTAITFFNLTDSNITQPLTLNSSLSVNGTLNVNGANAILSPVAAAVISGTGTLTGTGTARATRTAATADFLTQYTITNKTFTNLTIDYNGAGNQTVNNAPAYSDLVISGSGNKTLQGNTVITGDLNIAAATLVANNNNFALGGNWTNSAAFTPGTGTVTFQGSAGTQTLTGNTTFFNLTLNNTGATTNFGTTTTTIGNDFVTTAGTMDGGTSTLVFTGVTDNAGSISGAAQKNFHNLQINSPAVISNSAGGAIAILNDFANAGTFTQSSGQTTTFASGPDGAHSLSGAGTTQFGVFAINTANTVTASNSFNVIGATFTVNGTGVFTGSTNTVTFNAAGAQGIAGDGAKNFSGLTINNPLSVTVINGTSAVDASVSGALTLTTDLTTGAGAILQQSGTSAGAADVIGTVRRTDLGGVARSFGNFNNQITINSGTAPTQMDFNLVKAAPGTFPAGVKVVPRDITLTPTGGSGISATLRLRYIDPTELTPSSITESRLVLWKNISTVWTPQGGTPDAANNYVQLSGITSFSEWAIAEASDLTLSKANNVAGSAVTGQSWNWTLTAANSGAPATFTTGQTIISDNLPNSNVNYGPVTVQNVSNITGSANINCSIVSNDLTCTASGGNVTFASDLGTSSFDVVFSATPQAAGSYSNPRGGGAASIDPLGVIVESTESNNSVTTNTVTVGKANTTTAITSDNPDPSVVGEAVTVQWSVTVNSPGTLGAALTGNVTVTDGTAQCIADVSAGQCNITFTTQGAKNLTATYAGDTNYNGSASTPATPHTVNKADTTTTITSDNPDPSTPGQSVTVQWTTTVDSPGAGTLTGNVTVTVSGGAETCNAPVLTGQCSVVLNTGGNRIITANYPGDANFNGSSDTEGHQVCTSSLVTTNADSGAGSLRQVIADACDGATVTFDSTGVFATPQTITLTTGELLIDKNLTINAGTNRVTVSGNNASRVFHVNATRTVSLIGLTVTGGSASTGGGALNEGTLNVVNSTFTGNTATTDGGAIHQVLAPASLTLVNTTISGNNANEFAGGIDVLGGSATIINSTITNNRADADAGGNPGAGGGLRTGGTAILRNTIVAGNFIEAGASDTPSDISGPVDGSSSNNLVGVDTGITGGITNGVNGNQVGTGASPINPQLAALTDNGGSTQTHALLGNSPALDAGSNANLPVDTFDLDGDTNVAETLPVDQRGTGFPRTADSADANTTQTVDIGAYELHPSVENITDKTTAEDTALPQITFNIGDGTGALITSVTATSSNTTLIPNANVVVTGSGATRMLDIAPAPDANSPADGTSTITVTVTATNGQTAVDTFVVTVTEVNDTPVPTNDTVADIDEDSGVYSIPLATLLANDTNKGAANESGQTLTVTNVSSPTGGTAVINGTNVDFTPTANFFGAAGFTYTATDNGTTNGVSDPKSGNATVSFNINAINDPPSFTIAGNPPAVGESAGPQTVLNFATSISQGPNETGQTLTFNVSANGTTGSLTFSTAPAIDSTTGTLTYTATNSTFGTATFNVTLSDNGSNTPPNSNTSGVQSFTITVNGVGAPVVTATGGNLAYNENAGAVAIDPGLTVTDSNSTDLTGATVSITAGLVSAQDTLAFTDQLGITGMYNGATGVLTLSGTTTVANYQTALRTVTYQNSSENPTSSRTVTFTVNDGTATGSATRGISITAINDGPVNTVPGPQGTAQNTALVFSSGNGNQISVSDLDAGASTVQVTLTATNGTMTLSTVTGLSFGFSDGNGTGTGDGTNDPTMTFRGTLTDINAALNGMSFNPTPAFTGPASVNIISNDLGNTGTGGPLTDNDTVNIQVATNVGIQDAQVVEPPSGSVNMIFTVSLSAPAPVGGASVNFTTQDQAPAPDHATAGVDYTTTSGTVNFAVGEQVKTITVPVLFDGTGAEIDETFLVVLSSPVNATIVDSTATGTILTATPTSDMLITELRTSGPGGAGDDFVEVYNNTDAALTVTATDASAGYGLFKMGADCSAPPVLIGTIPNGTVIPARAHFLFVGSAYSLGDYGGTGAAAGNLTLSSDIEDDRNVAIFTTSTVANISTANRLDAVGFGTNTGGTCDLLREGTTLTPMSGSVLQYSYVRDECGKKGNPALFGPCPSSFALPVDSNVNNDDFIFVDTAGTITPAGQRLGAPGPENLSSPTKGIDIATTLLDSNIGAPAQPNRVRDFTAGPNAANGTLSIRRRFTNNTGNPITRLRFRIVDFSSISAPSGIAELRALSSGSVVVNNITDPATCLASTGSATTPCVVTVLGTTLETPPAQALGGAHNSSMSAGTITLASPLADGASINLQFLLGVQQTGSFKFFINLEANPNTITSPLTSSPAKGKGRVKIR